MTAQLVIPWRDRGLDPYRAQNLQRVLEHWEASPWSPMVVDDGLGSDEPFNRSAAYNRAAAQTDADVLVFSEGDLLVPYNQISQGIELATADLGMVVPFSRFMEIDSDYSVLVRSRRLEPEKAPAKQIRGDRQSIGAVNILSRATYDAIGSYPEKLTSNWYDDDLVNHAFEICTQKTRFIDGPAFHLYHASGSRPGAIRTAEDDERMQINRRLWERYRRVTSPAEIRRFNLER